MAIFIEGMTCSICERPMKNSEGLVGFRPFVSNHADPIYMFSDGTFHRACVEQHPHGNDAITWNERARKVIPAEGRCEVCHERVLHPDDYVGTGFLAGSEQDPLYAFNFVHLHRNHIPIWPRLAAFTQAMQEAEETGRWQGSKLSFDPARPEALDSVPWPPRS